MFVSLLTVVGPNPRIPIAEEGEKGFLPFHHREAAH